MGSGNSSKPDPLSTDCVCGHTKNWHPATNGQGCTADGCICESFEKPENVHRWKRCDQCRHPEHSSACTVCRCLAVTSMEEIAETCRRAGGCPEHLLPPKCDHPNPQFTGTTQGGGEPTLKHYKCSDCNERFSMTEETPQGAEEPWPCGDCGATVPAGQGWCAEPDCREKAQGHLKAEAEECVECGSSKVVYRNFEDMPFCAPCADGPQPPQPERRPPYAVAYSAGGHMYEALLPGDATATAVDGRLVIEHPDFQVLAITRVMPVRTEASS